jgi:imidazoleglycerol phosphate synthase glutamine amidotransferase subunit HisH
VQCFGRRDTKGLGIFDIDVIKFTTKVKVPQMGWNQIYNLKSPLFDGIAENEYMYLVHSFLCSFALKLLRLQIMKWNMHQLCKG